MVKGRWIPYIGDTDVINKSFSNLLKDAREKLDKRVLSVFRDEIGMVAFEVDDYIVVAKSYVYGWIVSAHKNAVLEAQNRKKRLLMYIKRADKFYFFRPEEIIDNGRINRRGGSEMLNFDIRIGAVYNG
jgi:hypothetical protein